MSESPRVVIVEDADSQRILAEELFRREGFDVWAAGDGASGLELVRRHDPDVVILDLVLPDLDGYEVCRRIRAESDSYVIMVTSKDAEVDRVVGLTVGADDYVVKPFSPPELVARVRARLRRPRAAAGVAGRATRAVNGLTLDPDGREVTVDGEVVDLTRIEFDLLEALTERPRQVLTRDQLLARIWGDEWVGEGHLLEVHVSKLRRKLGDDAGAPRFVQTVRGVGYRMAGGSSSA